MNTGICFVVGAGADYGLNFVPRPGDCVIGADGGFTALTRHGLSADLVIGDLDTLPDRPDHRNVVTLPKEKDDTDTWAAVHEGIRGGYRTFHLYGCTGGRLDHTLANIQLLAFLSQQGMTGFLFDRDSVITAITDRRMTFGRQGGGYISVFSHSETSEGVCLTGLKYELDNAALTGVYPLGVSNEFTGGESVISVRKGTLVIVFPEEAMKNLL